MSRPISFRWLGVAGIEITADDGTLTIDPFFTRPPFWRLWIGRVRPNRELTARTIRRCDWCLVTHAHWDHVMDVPDVADLTGAQVIGSPNVCRLLTACGVPQAQITQARPGDVFSLGVFEVEVLSGEHVPVPGFGPGLLPARLTPPLRLRDYRMDGCYSYLIRAAGQRLLYWSSVRPDAAPRADALFVNPLAPPEAYAALLAAVTPRLIVPVHWDDLFAPLSRPTRPMLGPPRWAWPPLARIDLDAFTQTLCALATDTRVWVPERFQAYELF